VYQRKPDLHYFLGFAHLRYAEAVREGMDISAVCLPYLEEIHNETEETTFFTLLSGSHCVVMEMCGLTNVRIAVGLGEIMPLHCSATGKAVLAFLSNKEQERVLQTLELTGHTDHTITSKEKLRKELNTIRKTGISCCRQEFHKGINAIAVPIFDNNRVYGSLAIVGTSVDLDKTQMEEYGELLLTAGAEITEKIGGTFPIKTA
jgi:DNA-binding IclR family transcriptional regulator